MSLSATELQEAHVGDNVQPNLYAAIIVCLPAAYLAVALRFTARRLKRTSIGKDDCAILVALVHSIASLVGAANGQRQGFTSAHVAMCIFGL